MDEISNIRKIKIGKLEGDFISGDKNIYFPSKKTIYDLDDQELIYERDFCKGRISELYLKRIVPQAWLLIGSAMVLYFLYLIILPKIFKTIMPADWAIVVIALIIGSIAPALWLAWIRYNDDEILMDYKFNYKECTKILRKRGKL